MKELYNGLKADGGDVTLKIFTSEETAAQVPGTIPASIFFIFPVVFTSSKRFALQNVALRQRVLASISLRHRLFIFLSGTKALLLKDR